MSKIISTFRSADGEAQYLAAYDVVLKQWPVPYEELHIPTRFGDTHVVASGRVGAPPVLLLHPAGGGAVIWIRNVGPLSRNFRVFAIDTIGETNKSLLIRRIGVRQRPDFAAWMDDLLKGLQIERADLVGNSFGGFLAFSTALSLPERVRKIVLISPAATFVPITAWTLHFMPANAIGPLIGSRRLLLGAYEWIWQGFPKDESIARLRSLAAIYGVPRHWSPGVFSDQELRSVRAPVLLLIGDHEVIYKPQDAIRRATRLVPGIQAQIVPNANHIAEYTAPEFVNSAILEFLA